MILEGNRAAVMSLTLSRDGDGKEGRRKRELSLLAVGAELSHKAQGEGLGV